MGEWLEPVRWTLLGSLLALATVTDLRSRRIPNALTLAGCLAGLAFSLYAGGVDGLGASAVGLLIAFALSLPFWLFGWMGRVT